MRSASEGEPREFWNILNNLNKSTSKRDEIDLDNLYEYFKILNIDNHPDDDVDEFILPNCDYDFLNNILNGEVSNEEIFNAVKIFKTSKPWV